MAQRRVLTPARPVQKATPKVEQAEYVSSTHSPKRRRSNDGQVIPVCKPPKPSQTQRVKQPPPTSSPLTELGSSQFPPTPTPANIDYQAVLLDLSNEYISAAYSMSSALAMPEVSVEQLDEYHGLLSTGMGCLESALKNFRAMDARMEARIRLRLASLLYEETDNDTEAEEILSKGLSACERARLSELKYAMLHLLARLWYKGGKSKAAMKAVEKHITEVEKLNLVHWIYAFRFLRVSLGLQADNSYVESSTLVRQLTAINAVADRHHDAAVQIVAFTMEALIHLRARTPDSVDLAQRALAAARMHQTSPEMAAMPQARALLNYIDLGCSIMHFNLEQASAKMRLMQGDLDSANRDSSWCRDGSWHVQLGAIRTSSINIDADTGGVVCMVNGQPSLVFKWFTKMQIYILAFMFSSLCSMHKNASSEQKAEAFLDEALKMSKIPIESAQQSVSAASTQYNTQRLLRVNLRLYVVFAFCGRSDWDKALKGIENIRKDIDELEEDPGADIMSLIAYLEAVCKHGLADLKGALKLYQSPQLQVPSHVDAKAAAGGISPIRVLAALNSILIMRHFGKREEADRLLIIIEPACHVQSTSYGNEYGSKAIESAFMILKAIEPPNRAADNLILKTKQHLQVAVSAAKIALNNQLLCIVMNIMTDLFFHNIVGDQAEKSARAGRTLAKKSQDKLWTAVADRMYGNTLEKCGKTAEAAAVRREAQEAMERMPESLKVALLTEQMDES
ncbi:hypothetical protein DOTSEDRAFT_124072 [Dothistroma septosporum NZE10]|uniref:Uncharacterized protein n=1 Tax=Dothistroma septosporum (strain NZE10 / CBS 128990) TaxID=675120 RepID=N1Q0X0_DOTSN|nr:hypothetical protein DOTSEDRAFT_124072 [Dothistroma septosporum NZE10]